MNKTQQTGALERFQALFIFFFFSNELFIYLSTMTSLLWAVPWCFHWNSALFVMVWHFTCWHVASDLWEETLLHFTTSLSLNSLMHNKEKVFNRNAYQWILHCSYTLLGITVLSYVSWVLLCVLGCLVNNDLWTFSLPISTLRTLIGLHNIRKKRRCIDNGHYALIYVNKNDKV